MENQIEEPYSKDINNLRISLWDYENANGSFPPSELRNFAEYVGQKLARIETEREVFIYWLLQGYKAINRAEWDEGKTFAEISDSLLNVLANVGYDPNLSDAAKELLRRPEVSHIDSAMVYWDKNGG